MHGRDQKGGGQVKPQKDNEYLRLLGGHRQVDNTLSIELESVETSCSFSYLGIENILAPLATFRNPPGVNYPSPPSINLYSSPPSNKRQKGRTSRDKANPTGSNNKQIMGSL